MLKALILCGGKSSRMGEDKGTIKSGDRFWSQVSADLAAKVVGNEVYVSVNESQIPAYSSIFTAEQIIPDEFPFVEGPLKGIMSAHKNYPSCDWIVLSCDMPYLTEDILPRLESAYKQNKGFDYYLFNSGQDHPFPGIYTGKSLKWIYNYALIGRLQSFGIKYIHTLGSIFRIQQQSMDNPSFINANYRSDIRRPF